MKHVSFFSKTLLLSVVMLLAAGVNVTASGMERPKLVVGIVIDQMRWDYLYRYYNLYGEGGFKRMMNEGFNFENTMINYLPAYTAVGHTSIYTGTVPSVHGITGNTFYENGKWIYCCDDDKAKTVGSDTDNGGKSPKNMLSSTIGDELKLATDYNSKVIGVSLKDRAAILPAGHSADAAYWMDFKTGRFITSSFYMKELPQWVSDFNKTTGKVTKDDIQYTELGNKLTAEMAKAAVTGEKLGLEDRTDMLTISFSCTDMVGHKYGTHSEKTKETYLDVDRRLADLFLFLDNRVGKGQYLVFFMADHGAANNILMQREHGFYVDGFFQDKTEKALDTYLSERYKGCGKLVGCMGNDYVFIDRKAVKASGLDTDDVKKSIVEWLEKDPIFAYVVDMEHLENAVVPAVIKEKIINGHNRRRCGDIRFILRPGCYEVYGDKIDGGTTHGAWNPYDAHIPFLMMGWNVKHGSTQAPLSITDIAPTVCAHIHIQMPDGCTGTATGCMKKSEQPF